MVSRSKVWATLLLVIGLQGAALAETKAISPDHVDFASRMAHRCTETETRMVPDQARRKEFCICYGSQFVIGLTSEELRTLDLDGEFADRKSKLALAACGAVQMLSPAEQGLARTVAAGCSELALEGVPYDQRQEFCSCMGEQTVLALTDDDLRIIRLGKDRQKGEAITAEKTRRAAEACGAEIAQ